MNNEKIGKFIKDLRKEKNLTQKELADMIGVTDRAVSKWERGLGCPDISLLESVANALDISIIELLKGEKLNNTPHLKDKDLLDSMTLGKILTINKFKQYFNIFTIITVTLICLLITTQNLKNMYLIVKKYDTTEYYIDNSNLIKELDNLHNIILSNQGKFTDKDYQTITSYIKIMNRHLNEQNNFNYLKKENYNYFKILSFYLDHQNIRTLEINNLDLYGILLTYDTSIYKNIVTYENTKEYLTDELNDILYFLQLPYFNHEDNSIYNYKNTPSPYNFIRNTYYNEITLAEDIIKAGELNEK